MKRRKFGLAGSSLLAVAASGGAKTALAQSYAPDPNLLKTTLTPFGSERAGNADGSIPPWTGGVVLPPLGPDQPQDVPMFEDEAMLYRVDASNMSQYNDLLSDGLKTLFTEFGMWVRVFPTHRTHALPQFVMDSIAANVTRAQLDPAGGRFGFTGGYGGIPFPIIDTANPLNGGSQLIWNHLLCWVYGYAEKDNFISGWVVIDGRAIMTLGALIRTEVPYYDPNGSPETYGGYYTKLHSFSKAPASTNGQEDLVWHTSNTTIKPDITWTVVSGQGRVRKAPDEAYDTPNPNQNGIGNFDDSSLFYGSPQKYDWKVLGKKEMLVPYNCNQIAQSYAKDFVTANFPNPNMLRWEKHRVWVLEATLHPGERNTTARRMCYLDEDTYSIQLTEMYDSDGTMVKIGIGPQRCMPHMPGSKQAGFALWETGSKAYTVTGFMKVPPYNEAESFGPESAEYFDPEQMAASASF